MKAIVMTTAGGPEVLQPRTLPKPHIQRPNQILVRLRAAGTNPVDTKLRSRGTYFPDRMPAVLGCDGSGVVEACGPQVARFRVGDEVYFCAGGIGDEQGTYAEYVVLDERHAAIKPVSLSFAEAAVAPLVAITAWESLHDRGRIGEGMRVLIHGGAGGVGHVAIQLARVAGAAVATTVGNEEKADLAHRWGAEHVIHYKHEDFVQSARAWTNDQGVDLALDTVGGATFAATMAAVKVYGDVVTLLQPAEMDWKEARLRNLRVSYELMLTPMYYQMEAARAYQARILEQCARLFDTGQLRIHLGATLPLGEAAEAHRRIERGHLGKLALLMDD
ncbi:zinc-dependent alcohol dehydrogenase family protein [Ectothiorhodospiraceae bacterium 2226]|nr:zinc-dependent alcohol dehydrogenase family protein [Ectothiorhodospiraceae bacterium 2226]